MQATQSHRTDLQVLLNGNLIHGLLQATIVTSNCFSSDSYALTFSVGTSLSGSIAFWSTLSSAYVEISEFTAFQQGPQTLISGMIDTIHINPITGIVAVEGRDLSSLLIDAYRQQDFVNQTASEVASTIAAYHGLTPVVTATSDNVGRYYDDGYTRLSLGQFSRLRSDWDLVVQLARENSFDVFVQDNKLFFQPSTSSSDIPLHIAFCDVKAIHFEQSLTVNSNTTARVQSWSSQNMMSYASDGENTPQLTTAASNQPFLFSASNFTSEQVTNSAQRYAAEVRRLNTILHIEMPWDTTFLPRTTILIDETRSELDLVYRIDTVERHYSTTLGSSQNIRAVVN